MRISAAELPELPSEIAQEISLQADTVDSAAENILNLLQINKKLRAAYEKNPQQYINTIIQELAKKFKVDEIVAAAYLYKNPYARTFLNTQVDNLKKLLDSDITEEVLESIWERRAQWPAQLVENFDHSIEAISLLDKAWNLLPIVGPSVLRLLDAFGNYTHGLNIKKEPELLIINGTKIPLIGCKFITCTPIKRKNDFLLYVICKISQGRLLSIFILDTNGNVKNTFTTTLTEFKY